MLVRLVDVRQFYAVANVDPTMATRLKQGAAVTLTLDAGQFERVDVDTRTMAVRVTLAPASVATPRARLRVEQPFTPVGGGTYAVTAAAMERGAYTIALGASPTRVDIVR